MFFYQSYKFNFDDTHSKYFIFEVEILTYKIVLVVVLKIGTLKMLVHFREDLNLALDRVVLGSSEDSEDSRLAALFRLELLLRPPLWSLAAASSPLPLVLSPLLWPLLQDKINFSFKNNLKLPLENV